LGLALAVARLSPATRRSHGSLTQHVSHARRPGQQFDAYAAGRF